MEVSVDKTTQEMLDEIEDEEIGEVSGEEIERAAKRRLCFMEEERVKKIAKRVKLRRKWRRVGLVELIKQRKFDCSFHKTFSCPHCSTTFDTPSAIGGHTAKYHPGK